MPYWTGRKGMPASGKKCEELNVIADELWPSSDDIK